MHAAPTPSFFVRRGYYKPMAKPHRVPRFKCRECNKGFSRQTFRQDYYDKKPHLNAKVIKCLSSGMSYRQSARMLSLTRSNFINKARKIQSTMDAPEIDLVKRAGKIDNGQH